MSNRLRKVSLLQALVGFCIGVTCPYGWYPLILPGFHWETVFLAAVVLIVGVFAAFFCSFYAAVEIGYDSHANMTEKYASVICWHTALGGLIFIAMLVAGILDALFFGQHFTALYGFGVVLYHLAIVWLVLVTCYQKFRDDMWHKPSAPA